MAIFLGQMKSRSSSIQRGDSTEKPTEESRRKWTSALRVVTAVTRLKNLPTKSVSHLISNIILQPNLNLILMECVYYSNWILSYEYWQSANQSIKKPLSLHNVCTQRLKINSKKRVHPTKTSSHT